jgi:hypothetical protein
MNVDEYKSKSKGRKRKIKKRKSDRKARKMEVDSDSSADQTFKKEVDSEISNDQTFKKDADSETFNDQMLEKEVDSDIPIKKSRELQAFSQQLTTPAEHLKSSVKEYIGIPRATVKALFAEACHLNHTKPSVDDILLRVPPISIDHGIVKCIISAAERLLPVDKTPQGVATRQEKQRITAEASRLTEAGFCTQVTRLGYVFLRQDQQRGEKSTPDLRFKEPIKVNGRDCFWIEYKNYFGFTKNPSVTESATEQLKRYVSKLGPGAVVHKFGFEEDYMKMDGVMVFREKEMFLALMK